MGLGFRDPWSEWLLGVGPLPEEAAGNVDLSRGPAPIEWGTPGRKIESGELMLGRGAGAPSSGVGYDNGDLQLGQGTPGLPARPTPPAGSIAKVTIDGKTYDYSRGSSDRAPMLVEPSAYPGYEAPEGGLGLSREVVEGPSRFGTMGASNMPPSTITREGMEESAAQQGRGVSMMRGTPEMERAAELERLQGETGIAEQQAKLMKARMGGPMQPGQPVPRTYEDAKRDENRQRLMGIEQRVRAQYDPNTREGAVRRAQIAEQAAKTLEAADPKRWATMPPEQRIGEIEQEVATQIESLLRSEFERALVIESVLSGSASPAAQYLRPRPVGAEMPTYYTY